MTLFFFVCRHPSLVPQGKTLVIHLYGRSGCAPLYLVLPPLCVDLWVAPSNPTSTLLRRWALRSCRGRPRFSQTVTLYRLRIEGGGPFSQGVFLHRDRVEGGGPLHWEKPFSQKRSKLIQFLNSVQVGPKRSTRDLGHCSLESSLA